MLKLSAQIREASENVTGLKKDGFIPAVFYGPKEKSTSIKISEKDFLKIFSLAGESSVIILNDGKEDHESLIHDVQFDAVSGRPIHADFYIIEKGKKISVHVPINFIGESSAEKTLGGVLIKVLHELEIEAMPKDLPHSVDIDISSLIDFESKLFTRDIKLPNGVELKISPDEVIALVQEHKEEVVVEAPTAEDIANVEIEKKGKTGEAPVAENKAE